MTPPAGRQRAAGSGRSGRRPSAHPVAALALALALSLPAPARAQNGPLSAIDWLSDSVTLPAALPGSALSPPGEPPVTAGALPEPITVTPLDAPSPDGIGLIDAAEAGLPPGLWGPSEPEELARLISAFPTKAPPAVQRQMRLLLIARLDPPRGAGPAGLLFRARIDALLARGALPEALEMLDRADPRQPEFFRRAFDAALLLGREEAGCERLRDAPGIAPSVPVRIFCLARNGDWSAAALTLETARALDEITSAEDQLLARFLDADIAEETALLALPPVPTPLTFRMLEAIGEALPTGSLPLAYAQSDLRPTAGWRAQIDAAERLARAGALPAERLMAIYGDRTPAASGGVWERVGAVQALEAALAADDRRGLARTLPRAWTEMAAADLLVPLAEAHGAAAAELRPGRTAAPLALRLGLLSSDYESVADGASATTTDPADRLLLDIARGLPPAPPDEASDLARAVAAAFVDALPPPEGEIAWHMGEGRLGESLLLALRPLADGVEADPGAITAGLAHLRRLGLEDAARRAALQILIAEETA